MLAVDLDQKLAVRHRLAFEVDSLLLVGDFLLHVLDPKLLLAVRQIGVQLVAARSHLLQLQQQLLLLRRDPRRDGAVFFFAQRRIRRRDSTFLHSRQFRLPFTPSIAPT